MSAPETGTAAPQTAPLPPPFIEVDWFNRHKFRKVCSGDIFLSERQKDGNLLKSIEMNAQRFGYDDQLKQIFINTAKLFDEQEA